jgi:hypothetical protein
MCHSFGDCFDRFPCMIILLFRVTMASLAVKVQVQSASQSLPMLNRLVDPSAGNSSVVVASVGRLVKFRFAVCVDLIVDRSGRVTLMGAVVALLLWQGTLVPLKCPVDPVSAIAVVVGGPSSCVAWFALLLITMLLSLLFLGSPPRHAGLFVVSGVGALKRSSLTQMVEFPFCMLLRVAAGIWPSAG